MASIRETDEGGHVRGFRGGQSENVRVIVDELQSGISMII